MFISRCNHLDQVKKMLVFLADLNGWNYDPSFSKRKILNCIVLVLVNHLKLMVFFSGCWFMICIPIRRRFPDNFLIGRLILARWDIIFLFFLDCFLGHGVFGTILSNQKDTGEISLILYAPGPGRRIEECVLDYLPKLVRLLATWSEDHWVAI